MLVFPSQLPVRDFTASKDFCPADWAMRLRLMNRSRVGDHARLSFMSDFSGDGVFNCIVALQLSIRYSSFLVLFSFFFVFAFHEGFQISEADGPEFAILIQPGIDRFQRLGIQLIEAVPPFSSLLNQVRAAQDAKVL